MSDDEIVVPGSVAWLGEMVKTAVASADEAKRRFWRATDEVARLRRDLSAAEERLAAAEREYHDGGKLMWEIWGQLRGELENARPARIGVEDDGYDGTEHVEDQAVTNALPGVTIAGSADLSNMTGLHPAIGIKSR